MMATGFWAGTHVRTPGGPIPVEALIEGELVSTESGRLVPVIRLMKSRFDSGTSGSMQFTKVGPIRIVRGAFADNQPFRDLSVAPGQKLRIAGALVPAILLINGVTVYQDRETKAGTYFNTVLEHEDLLVVEDIAAAGQPRMHATQASIMDLGSADEPSPAIASLSGTLVTARKHLLQRAAAMGFETTEDPGLYLVTKGTQIHPAEQEGRVYRFKVPAFTEEIRLRSRTYVPRDMIPGSIDDRQLGVAVTTIEIESNRSRLEIPLADPSLSGFYDLEFGDEKAWRWSDGDGAFRCPPLDHEAVLTVQIDHRGLYLSKRALRWVDPRSRLTAAAASKAGGIVVVSGEPETPGHRYRVLDTVAATERLGIPAIWLRADEILDRRAELQRAEVLIVWRAPYEPRIETAIAAVRANGGKVLVDMDDLMFDPRLARPDLIDAIRFNRFSQDEVRDHYARMRESLAAADGCLCTTPQLAIHAREQGCAAVWVLPNGFDEATERTSRMAVRQKHTTEADPLIRIGYAAGSRTHQRDFAVAAPAVAQVLRQHPDCRLVLFRRGPDLPVVDPREFPELTDCTEQIEWREMVDLSQLPWELARFDINLAPLELGNPFCEAKSELKYFEAALAGVCTIASPTGPFRQAIRDGETGLLAGDTSEWYRALSELVTDGPRRHRMSLAAYHDVLWTYGPRRRSQILSTILAQLAPGETGAAAFELARHRQMQQRSDLPEIPKGEVIFAIDRLASADVTVVIPLYNYAHYVSEALDSVWHQTVPILDLVIVDDCSADSSLTVANEWLQRHAARFNRIVLVRNLNNSGLSLTRNAGFAAAETPYVLPLDADNRIYPRCAETCLRVAHETGAAFVYPRIQQFGGATDVIGGAPFVPMRLSGGNYIDAMALIAKDAWAAAGGYARVTLGWEDYDFWCTLAERGVWGQPADQILAEYRVHEASMCQTVTDLPDNKRELLRLISNRHSWLTVAEVQAAGERNRRLEKTDVQPPGKSENRGEKRRTQRSKPRRSKSTVRS